MSEKILESLQDAFLNFDDQMVEVLFQETVDASLDPAARETHF